MAQKHVNVTATTVAGGLIGGFTADKHRFVGTIGGAIVGAVLGTLLDRYASPYPQSSDSPDQGGPQPMSQIPQDRGQYR